MSVLQAEWVARVGRLTILAVAAAVAPLAASGAEIPIVLDDGFAYGEAAVVPQEIEAYKIVRLDQSPSGNFGVPRKELFSSTLTTHYPRAEDVHTATTTTDIGEFGPLARASVDINALGVDTSSARALLAYYAKITSNEGPGLPIFDVPVKVTATAIAGADDNGFATAMVSFLDMSRSRFAFDGTNTIISINGDFIRIFDVHAVEQFGIVSQPFDTITWEGFLRVERDYGFSLRAVVTARANQGEPVSAFAMADPLIEFDQATFDEMMGDDTFPLAEAFTIRYSSNIEAAFVPEPAAIYLVVVGLGLLGLARRRLWGALES